MERSGINDSEDLFLLIAMCRLKFRPCGNVPPQIPTFLQVADICRIAKRSGLDDDKNIIFTNSNVPPQIPTLRQCAASNSDHFIGCGYMQDSKMAELNDGKDFIFTNSNVPPQKSHKRNCKNDVHFQYAVFAFIE